MADFIGQMFFEAGNGNRLVGWSEDHYILGAANDAEALEKFSPLVEARANLLGAGAVCSYVRVSDVAVFRDSQIAQGIIPDGVIQLSDKALKFTVIPNPKNDPSAPISPVSVKGLAITAQEMVVGVGAADLADLIVDQPQVGYLVRLEAGAPYTNRRSLCLRGMPDGVVVTGSNGPSINNGTISANWLKLFSKWAAKMIAGGSFGFRGQDTAQAANKIANWTVPDDDYVTATIPGLGAEVGDRVRVSGVKIKGKAPGSVQTLHAVLTVRTAPGANVYTFYSTDPDSPFTKGSQLKDPAPLKNGTATKIVRVILPYKAVVGRRWGERKVGLPFDPAHGRRRTRK